MKDLADVMAAADSVGAIIALCLIGIFALLWKYGGQLLKRVEHNTTLTQQAADDAAEAKGLAEHVSASIVTNHGSKNLGDAIDRLTEWVAIVRAESKLTREEMGQVNVRLSALEARPAPAATVVVNGSSDVQPDC